MLTADSLRIELSYNPRTGEFTRLMARSQMPAGSLAGYLGRNGYWYLSVCGKEYLAHRLAWLYVHGQWPPQTIDHVNGQKADNRISNLRLASQAQNSRNAPIRCHNTSGYPGVYWHKTTGLWTARVFKDGRVYSLGYFRELLDAVAARQCLEERHYEGFVPRLTEGNTVSRETGTVIQAV